jgi:hypothetical protein
MQVNTFVLRHAVDRLICASRDNGHREGFTSIWDTVLPISFTPETGRCWKAPETFTGPGAFPYTTCLNRWSQPVPELPLSGHMAIEGRLGHLP